MDNENDVRGDEVIVEKTPFVKMLAEDENTAIYGGYGIVFGGRDLHGEYFSTDTDFMLPKNNPLRCVAWIDHALDGGVVEHEGKSYDVKGINDPVGETISVTPDDFGLYFEIMVEKASEYWQIVDSMVKTGRCGLSTGTTPHLVKRADDGKLERWPLGADISFTLTPAEPRTATVTRKKSDDQPEPDTSPVSVSETPEPLKQSAIAEDTQPVVILETQNSQMEDLTMTEQPILSEDVLASAIAKALQKIEANPRLKDGGYIAPDDEKPNGVKSFGDYLVAVKNRNTRRLAEVYGVKAALAEDTGATGGFLVPEDFANQIYALAGEMSIVAPRATLVRTNRKSVKFPVLDQDNTNTDRSNFHGGMIATWTEEAGAKTETEPTFLQAEVIAYKLAGYTLASDELLADNAVALEQFLMRLFSESIAWQEDYAFLRGNGVGKPLGILNSGATITVTRNAGSNDVDYVDLVTMYSKLVPQSQGRAVWIIHPTVWTSIFQLSDGTNIIWNPSATNAPTPTIFGLPVLVSEKLPASGTSGDIMLADLSQYYVVRNGQLAIDSSEHYKFINDQMTWRFVSRVGGRPLLNSAVTLPDGSNTVSPFVVLS